jgi:cell volume regulation protein A
VSDPVTVFMLVVSGLLVVGAVGEQIFARTGVPAVLWLILLGFLVRSTEIVPDAVVTMMAPFFAALALVLILFDAGRHLSVGAGAEPSSRPSGPELLTPLVRRRALLLALLGFAGTTLLVALVSMMLYGLNILPVWSWTHAFMLGSLMSAGAGEVFMPSLQAAGVDASHLALLRREAAITKALAVAGTVLFIDLLSPRIAVGGAPMAMIAGFGFAALFGLGVGIGWIIALQRLAENQRSYLYTMAAMIAAYVMSESAGGSGPLSVLLFGLVLGNAERLLRLLTRRDADTIDASLIHAALASHEGTIQFVRTLVFMMVGLMLEPSKAMVFGVAIGFVPLIVRLLVVRFVMSSSDHADRSAVGNCGPRGMATVALATLPLAQGVAGSGAMLTLVFSAVTTSVAIFMIGQWHSKSTARGELAEKPAAAKPPVMRAPSPAAIDVRAPTLREPQQSDEHDAGRLAPVEVAPPTGRTVAAASAPPSEPLPTDLMPLPAVATPLISAPPIAVMPVAVTPVAVTSVASEPVKGRTVVAPAPVGRTVVAASGPRAPLVGMQEQPVGVSGAIDREFAVEPGRSPDVYMPTLPTIDAAKAHGEDPLDSAMVRALSKRPEDISPRGGRAPTEAETARTERK